MRRTRGTQPTSAWRTTNVVARSAIIMVDHIQLSELAQVYSSSSHRSLGLAGGDDLPFLISSSATQKSGRGSSSRFAQLLPTQQHVSRFPAAGTTTTMILDVIWAEKV